MKKYYIQANAGDDSVTAITEDNNLLLARVAELEVADDNFDLVRHLLATMDQDSDLFFVDGKLEIRRQPSKEKQLRDILPQIAVIQNNLWLPNILREVVETGQSFESINALRIKREQEHGALQTERAKLQAEIDDANYTVGYEAAKVRLAKSDYQFENVICAIAKDETPYLIEWITYHLDLGVERIFLHDDGSKEPIRQTLAAALPQKYALKVTITDDSLKHPWTTQRAVYSRWLKEWEGRVKWVCFLDIDEFLVLKGKTVNEFLENLAQSVWKHGISPMEVGEINIGWVEYNAGGANEKKDGLVRERFQAVSPSTPFAKKFWMGKYFVRPEVIERIRIHETAMSPGFKRVSSEGFAVKPCCVASMEKGAYPDPLECTAYVAHYFTKSYEEWIEKIKRGACDNYLRKKKEFFWHNPDMLTHTDYDEQVYGT